MYLLIAVVVLLGLSTLATSLRESQKACAPP
jgi:hypothetical protein